MTLFYWQVGNPDYHRLITKCITRLNEQQAVMKEVETVIFLKTINYLISFYILPYQRRVQFRSPSVKFAVGLVMAYKGNFNKPHSFCVINSWTVYGKNEPRYNVLLDGGDSSLVPEGNITNLNGAITLITSSFLIVVYFFNVMSCLLNFLFYKTL